MRAKLLLSILSFSFGITGVVQAQTDDPAQEEARQTIERISQTFRNCENYAAHFIVSVAGELEDTKGVITVSGNKYNVVMPENYIIYDGQNLYNYNKADREVIIEGGEKGGRETSSLSNIFSLDVTHYNIRPADAPAAVAPGTSVVELTPRTPSDELQKLEISVRQGKTVPEEIMLFPVNGSPIRVVVTKVLLNIPEDPQLFIFDREKFKNAEIIDFR